MQWARCHEFVGGPYDRAHGRGGPGGWWILAEVDVRLTSHDIVRPDVSGGSPRLPSPWGVRPIDVVPDWICRDPLAIQRCLRSREKSDALRRTRSVVLLDDSISAERVLEAFKLGGGIWMRIGSYDDTAVARIAPFEDVEIAVGLLFPPISVG